MATLEKVVPIERPEPPGGRADRLGRILLDAGKLTQADVDAVLALQHAEDLPFGEAALRLALIRPADLDGALARQFAYPCRMAGCADASPELVPAHSPGHPRAEEMRTVRMQLLSRWLGAQAARRWVAIVSPGHGEGRSYVAANLAVTFAQHGERTLVVDADLRSPRQHRIFGVSNRCGLATVLAGRADSGSVQPAPGFGNLAVLPAGPAPPNPQELLLRPALPSLLERLAPSFDVVLFDTPPARACADGQGVALRAGSALVVARKDRSRLDHLAGLAAQLDGDGTAVLGTLLNAF